MSLILNRVQGNKVTKVDGYILYYDLMLKAQRFSKYIKYPIKRLMTRGIIAIL